MVLKAALLYNCGYMANLGLLSSIAQPNDVILYDEQVHASMHDGIRLSKAHSYPFRHNDVDHLEKRLQAMTASRECFVCVESVYSMDGSFCSLEPIELLCRHYKAHLIVDEAHAFGLFGEEGRGLVAEKGLTDRVFALVIPFGKALGVQGAAVFGRQILKDFLINFSRSTIYTTALPLIQVMAVKCAYNILKEMNSERTYLQFLIQHFRKGYPHSSSKSQIQSIKIGESTKASELSKKLALNGFDVRPILPPTVKRGEGCLRISLHAFNTQEEVSNLNHYNQYFGGVCLKSLSLE